MPAALLWADSAESFYYRAEAAACENGKAEHLTFSDAQPCCTCFAELLLLFLAFCGLFLAHAVTKGAQLFAKGQILAVAVHDEVCLVQAQLAFFVQQALVHIAGHHLGQNRSWLPSGMRWVMRHSRLTGLSSSTGQSVSTLPGAACRPQAANLSTSRPLFTPHQSMARTSFQWAG